MTWHFTPADWRTHTRTHAFCQSFVSGETPLPQSLFSYRVNRDALNLSLTRCVESRLKPVAWDLTISSLGTRYERATVQSRALTHMQPQ